jgi:uncharacterized membrane protein YbhN (UPF0104 family)
VSTFSRRLFLLLRVVVSVGLIAFMVSRLDLENMARFLRRADLGLVALTLVTVFVDRSFMVVRWVKLVEALDIVVSRLRVVKIFFLSTFFGSFLPSGVGGEAVRAVSFSRLTSRGVESVASVVMDRLLGLLSMLLMGLVSLTVFYRVYPHPALLGVVVLLSVGLIVGLALGLSRALHARVVSLGESLGDNNWLARAALAMGRYRDRVGTLGVVLLLSLGVQGLRVLQAYFLSEAMSLDTPLIYFLCFIPPILVVTMLPISVGGWGTTNVAYVGLFSQVGMDPDGAFVLSVLILALGVIGNLPGGLIYASEGFSASDAS